MLSFNLRPSPVKTVIVHFQTPSEDCGYGGMKRGSMFCFYHFAPPHSSRYILQNIKARKREHKKDKLDKGSVFSLVSPTAYSILSCSISSIR